MCTDMRRIVAVLWGGHSKVSRTRYPDAPKKIKISYCTSIIIICIMRAAIQYAEKEESDVSGHQ